MKVKQICDHCLNQSKDKGTKYCKLTARNCSEYAAGSDCKNWRKKNQERSL